MLTNRICGIDRYASTVVQIGFLWVLKSAFIDIVQLFLHVVGFGMEAR